MDKYGEYVKKIKDSNKLIRSLQKYIEQAQQEQENVRKYAFEYKDKVIGDYVEELQKHFTYIENRSYSSDFWKKTGKFIADIVNIDGYDINVKHAFLVDDHFAIVLISNDISKYKKNPKNLKIFALKCILNNDNVFQVYSKKPFYTFAQHDNIENDIKDMLEKYLKSIKNLQKKKDLQQSVTKFNL